MATFLIPLRLYLPLLTHADHTVRRQAYQILYCNYGTGVIGQLRTLLSSPEPGLREQARQAIVAVSELTRPDPHEEQTEGLAVQCLGTMRVVVAGRPLLPQDWAQTTGGRAGMQKVRAAFAYLVHCGSRGASREALSEAVWGGQVSPSSIARTLTTLRQALAAAGADGLIDGVLTFGEERCLLNPEGYQSDVAMFERVCELAYSVEEAEELEAAAPLYAQALDLYGGPYMADIARGSGWMLERREELAGSFLIASERMAEHLFTRQSYEECVRRCLQAIDEDPAADDLTAWLLRAYAKLGYSADLEHAFRRYTRAAGLGAGPWDTQDDPAIAAYRQLARHRALGT